MGKPRQESNSGEGELHTAARNGDMMSVQSICSTNPFAVNSRDKHSRTPLHLASWAGNVEVVNYLCKHKADIGASAKDDMIAIHFAAQKGHPDVVRTLVSFGASIKASTRKGFTPLHYAVQGSHLELVKYLLKKGASRNAKTKAGKTPLDLANNEEMRAFLEQYQEPSKEKIESMDANASKNADEDHNAISNGEKPVEPEQTITDETDNSKQKRKKEEAEYAESSPGPKKRRVSLSHLLTQNDDVEEEQNL